MFLIPSFEIPKSNKANFPYSDMSQPAGHRKGTITKRESTKISADQNWILSLQFLYNKKFIKMLCVTTRES